MAFSVSDNATWNAINGTAVRSSTIGVLSWATEMHRWLHWFAVNFALERVVCNDFEDSASMPLLRVLMKSVANGDVCL